MVGLTVEIKLRFQIPHPPRVVWTLLLVMFLVTSRALYELRTIEWFVKSEDNQRYFHFHVRFCDGTWSHHEVLFTFASNVKTTVSWIDRRKHYCEIILCFFGKARRFLNISLVFSYLNKPLFSRFVQFEGNVFTWPNTMSKSLKIPNLFHICILTSLHLLDS